MAPQSTCSNGIYSDNEKMAAEGASHRCVGRRQASNYISAEEAKWKIRRNSLSLVFHLLVQFPVEPVDSTLRLFVVGFYLIALLAQFFHEGVPGSFPLLPSRFAGLGK